MNNRKNVRYWSRDEIENIVKDVGIDRNRFYEYSKYDYEKVIKKFYYSFCDYEKHPEISLSYNWLYLRDNLISSSPIHASNGWINMLQFTKEQFKVERDKKLYLILSDGWVYKGFIDEIINVLSEITGNIEDFYIVSLKFDIMAAYCGDGDCVVIYSNQQNRTNGVIKAVRNKNQVKNSMEMQFDEKIDAITVNRKVW